MRVEQEAEQTRSKAVAARQRLHDDLKTIEFLLGSDIPDAEHDQREEGMALARAALDRYRVLESPRWQETPLVSALAREQREQVREDMGELLLLLAGAVAQQTQLDLALRLNDLAAGCYPADAVPRAIWRQRAELARSAGPARRGPTTPDSGRGGPGALAPRPIPAPAHGIPAAGAPSRSLALVEGSQPPPERQLLGVADPGKLLCRPGETERCPGVLRHGRRLVAGGPLALHVPRLGLPGTGKRSAGPSPPSTKSSGCGPRYSQAYYNRALAKYRLGDLAGARADLTHLLSEPKPPLRGYFLRAKVRAKQGDREGARRDQEEGLRGEPRDERDLTARAWPGSRATRGRPWRITRARSSSIRAIERPFRTRPTSSPRTSAAPKRPSRHSTRSSPSTRTTCRRLPAGGSCTLGSAAARPRTPTPGRALPRDTKPFNVYQVAGIYALTSRQNPDDRREALRLLESALSQGFGLDLLDKDRDLDAIRDQPEFRRLVEAARARRDQGGSAAAHRNDPAAAAVEQRGRTGDGRGAVSPCRMSPVTASVLDRIDQHIRRTCLKSEFDRLDHAIDRRRRSRPREASHGQVDDRSRLGSTGKPDRSGRPSGCPGRTPPI